MKKILLLMVVLMTMSQAGEIKEYGPLGPIIKPFEPIQKGINNDLHKQN